MKELFTTLLLILIFHSPLWCQKDTLLLNNKDIVTGDIKSLNNGVLTIGTDYSKDDFKIKWERVKRLKTVRRFLITLENGARLAGTLASTADDTVTILDEPTNAIAVNKSSVVYLKHIDKGFWNNFSASLDLGFSLTKANNLRQFSARSRLGYLTREWQGNADFSVVRSTQQNAERVERYDANLGARYFFRNDWLMSSNLNLLSNTEQALYLRSNLQVGPGKFIIHTNSVYWVAAVGIAYSNEQFSNEASSRNSMESYIAMDINMFNVGDLQLKSVITAYPGITESGRFRMDYRWDTKYNLPMDFYISLGLTLNYDNQPGEGGNKTDYVVQTGIGWQL